MRESDLWIQAASRRCPVCKKHGKGPLTYKCGRIVYRHMVKTPGKPGKKAQLCEVRPSTAGQTGGRG